MKYVVLRATDSRGLGAVVFAVSPVTHRELADAFAATHRPVSAGFCEPLPSMPTGKWRCFGWSSTLNLQPAPGDELLIEASVKATARSAPAALTAA